MEEGTTNFGVNRAGFMLHSAIHAARPDVKCVVHLHTPNIVAVSSSVADPDMFLTDPDPGKNASFQREYKKFRGKFFFPAKK